jgi:hypothetical protein
MNRCIILMLALSLPGALCRGADNDARFLEAEAAISQVLKDPESARFRDVRVVENSKGAKAIVGEVNAKNAYGGYTGFTPFVYSNGSAFLVREDDAASQKLYSLTGALGPKAELAVRLADEARFQSEVVWTLITNVVVQGESRESAVRGAVNAVAERAESNGGSLTDVQRNALAAQYSASLDATLRDKKLVKSIKTNAAYQKQVFVPVLYASTLSQLRAQMGLTE